MLAPASGGHTPRAPTSISSHDIESKRKQQIGAQNITYATNISSNSMHLLLLLSLEHVERSNGLQYVLLVELNNTTTHHHLIQDEVGTLQVEHQLKHIPRQEGQYDALWQREGERLFGLPGPKDVCVVVCLISDVQFAHILEILVERLYQVVDKFQDGQLVLHSQRSAHDGHHG